MKNNTCYVYIYLDPMKPGKFCYDNLCFLYEPFYVGKGTGRQYLRHLYDKNNKLRNPIKFRKIKHIFDSKLQPIIIKIMENLTNEKAYLKESEIIKKIGRINLKTGPLSNLNDGGKGGQNNPSKETRLKIGKGTRGKNYEEIHGPEKAKELKIIIIKSNKTRDIRKKIDKTKKGKTIEMFNDNDQPVKINTWKLTDPETNNIIITKNLSKTCKVLKLKRDRISQLGRGILKYYKGWECELIIEIY